MYFITAVREKLYFEAYANVQNISYIFYIDLYEESFEFSSPVGYGSDIHCFSNTVTRLSGGKQ